MKKLKFTRRLSDAQLNKLNDSDFNKVISHYSAADCQKATIKRLRSKIPKPFLKIFDDYGINGKTPTGLVASVVANDLFSAVAYGIDMNVVYYLVKLFGYMPKESYGSTVIAHKWSKSKGFNGLLEELNKSL